MVAEPYLAETHGSHVDCNCCSTGDVELAYIEFSDTVPRRKRQDRSAVRVVFKGGAKSP